MPSAAPPAATAPSLMSHECTWRCLAGAMAVPAGLDAAPPLVLAASAAPTPCGSSRRCAGAACGGVGAGADCACGCCDVALGAFGKLVAGTGCSGPFDGSGITSEPCCCGGCGCCCGADDCAACAMACGAPQSASVSAAAMNRDVQGFVGFISFLQDC